MNIMLIAVSIIFILCAVSGLIAGFLKKASGILSFILAGMIVSAILPGVTSWLRESTPIYSVLQEQCAKLGTAIAHNAVSGALSGKTTPDSLFGFGDGEQDGSSSSSVPSGGNVSGGSSASSSGLINPDGSVNREAVKALLSQYGYDSSAIDYMSDDQIKSFIAQYTGGVTAGAIDLPEYICRTPVLPSVLTIDVTMQDQAGGSAGQEDEDQDDGFTLGTLTDNMTAADKRKFIESLPIPEALQEQMETFNNSEGYAKLGATDFSSYVTGYFASLILNVIAYLVALLIAWIIIRLIIGALGIFTKLPLIGTADHILGLLLGLLQGLFIVWGLFLVLSLFSATPVGQTLLGQVYDSPVLEALYNTNMFLRGASSAMKGIL